MSNYPDNLAGWPNHANPMFDEDQILVCGICADPFEATKEQWDEYLWETTGRQHEDGGTHFECPKCDAETLLDEADYNHDKADGS